MGAVQMALARRPKSPTLQSTVAVVERSIKFAGSILDCAHLAKAPALLGFPMGLYSGVEPSSVYDVLPLTNLHHVSDNVISF